MREQLLAMAIIILLSLLGVAGDFFLKLAGAGSKSVDVRFFALGVGIYVLLAFGWFYAMKMVKLSTIGVVYSISTVVFLTILSVGYFKEGLTTHEMAGVLAALVALVLLGRFA